MAAFMAAFFMVTAAMGQLSNMPDTVKIIPAPVKSDSIKQTTTIVGVGDLMLGTNFPANRHYLPPDNGRGLLAPVSGHLQEADVTFGNMEGAISDHAPLEKRCRDTTKCYAFRMPTMYARHLKEAGFDMLSLANNHAWDFGIEGVNDAARTLRGLNIKFAGPMQYPWDTLHKDGIVYGLAAFAPNKGCHNINSYPQAVDIVTRLDSLADVVIVSFHGGAEGDQHQHIADTNEFYYGEDRGNVREFAHLMIDAGADVIFGHGPHVVRAAEVYKDRFIAYSLGNFATYARFNLRGVNGYAPVVKVHTDRQGHFQKAEVISCLQRGEGGPQPDPGHSAYFKMKALTEADISNHGLFFDDERQTITRMVRESVERTDGIQPQNQ